MLLALHSVPAEPATQTQIDSARDRAAAWLIGTQMGEGRWSNGREADIPITAQATVALSASNVSGIPALKAMTWLASQKVHSVDALSRSLLAQRAPNLHLSPDFLRLLSWRSPESLGTRLLWGAYPAYAMSLQDTALAWRSILTANYLIADRSTLLTNTLCAFYRLQRSNGGWPATPPQTDTTTLTPAPASIVSPGLQPTVQTMLFYLAAQEREPGLKNVPCADGSTSIFSTLTSQLNAAATFVASTVRGSNGAVSLASSGGAIAGAQAYQVLQRLRPSDVFTGALLDHLLTLQRADGSWGDDPMITAHMLETLSRIASGTTDANRNGVPDSIEAAMRALGYSIDALDPGLLPDKGVGIAKAGVNVPVSIATRIPVNVPYSSGPLAVNGGTSPYTWSHIGGVMPPGLVLRGTGVIEGTPNTVGSFTFAYRVTDAIGLNNRTVGQITVVRAAGGDGDINGDGRVDVADVVLAQRFVLRRAQPTTEQAGRADVAPPMTPDGVIDAADVARILRKALGQDLF